MKERPILFSGPMVRAILEGRKTQTRRVVKHQPIPYPEFGGSLAFVGKSICAPGYNAIGGARAVETAGYLRCPHGAPGDRLWVREAFYNSRGDDSMPTYYKADQPELMPTDRSYHQGPWRPSIHMPRWASRLTLEITGVRVERLQDISEEDAISEGVIPVTGLSGAWVDYLRSPKTIQGPGAYVLNSRDSFRTLWDSINGNRIDTKTKERLPYAWDDNPWVWVLEFRKLEGGAA